MPRFRACVAVALSLAAAPAHAQGDPKSQFVEALGQFSLALDGGSLDIHWREDGHVIMTGPAALAFEGSFDPASLAGSSR